MGVGVVEGGGASLLAVFINVSESLACLQSCQTGITSLTHLSSD